MHYIFSNQVRGIRISMCMFLSPFIYVHLTIGLILIRSLIQQYRSGKHKCIMLDVQACTLQPRGT